MQITFTVQGVGEVKITQQPTGFFDVTIMCDGVETELSTAGVARNKVLPTLLDLEEFAREVPMLARTPAGTARAAAQTTLGRLSGLSAVGALAAGRPSGKTFR